MASRTEKITARIRAGGRIKFLEADYLLTKNGFRMKRVSGSHHIYSNGYSRLTVPRHGKEVPSYVCGQILHVIEGD